MWVKVSEIEEFDKHIGKYVIAGTVSETPLYIEETLSKIAQDADGRTGIIGSGNVFRTIQEIVSVTQHLGHALYMWASDTEPIIPEGQLEFPGGVSGENQGGDKIEGGGVPEQAPVEHGGGGQAYIESDTAPVSEPRDGATQSPSQEQIEGRA